MTFVPAGVAVLDHAVTGKNPQLAEAVALVPMSVGAPVWARAGWGATA